MLPRSPRPARLLLVVASLLASAALAGCAGPRLEGAAGPTHAPEPTDPSSLPPMGLELEGVAWIGDAGAGRCWETVIRFPVNATGASLNAVVRSGAFYGIELPHSASSAHAELRDPSNRTLARAERAPVDPVEFELAATAETVGEHLLLLGSCFGGSDGSAHGEYIAYRLRVSGREADA